MKSNKKYEYIFIAVVRHGIMQSVRVWLYYLSKNKKCSSKCVGLE